MANHRAATITDYMKKSTRPVNQNYMIFIKLLKSSEDELKKARFANYDEVFKGTDTVSDVAALPHENEFILLYLFLETIFFDDLVVNPSGIGNKQINGE